MCSMAGFAVIFDVDGVLLDLTPAEEDLFFLPFEKRYGLAGLSRDWDSYRIRNDEDIIAEILERHGLPESDRPVIAADYVASLRSAIAADEIHPVEISGARALLIALCDLQLGIATANLLSAARLRLEACGLWFHVAHHAAGAEGGGHKRDVLARAIASCGLPPGRIVYVGDNLNDVEAGRANGVHFIGFSERAERRERLAAGGARWLSGDHAQTLSQIEDIIARAGP